ncbi:MAG: right-handed parallel beta-helix repeat-containing protein [Capsulimonadaceae bacterium]|nr:right-handed parallel beta-helix repeat-containing protein [Capsulimonadaceae bacterium]
MNHFSLHDRVIELALICMACFAALLAVSPAQAASPIYEWSPTADMGHGGSVTLSVDRFGAKPVVLATANGGEWNWYFALPQGVLKAPGNYVAQLDYEIVTPTTDGREFYMFARTEKLGYDNDIWVRWKGPAGTKGTATLPMTLRGVDDWSIQLGIHGNGAIKATGLRIFSGSAGRYVPAVTSAKPVVVNFKDIAFPIPTGCGPVAIDPPHNPSGPVLSAADFGLKFEAPGAEPSADVAAANVDAFRAAVTAARTQGASVLRFPKGLYRFASSAPLALDDLHDITIDGGGSEFLFVQYRQRGGASIKVSRCERALVKDLFVDWDWSVRPIATIAHVDSVDAGKRGAVFTFPDITGAATELLKTVPWQSILPLETLRPTGHPAKAGFGKPEITGFETLAANKLHVAFAKSMALESGGDYWIRHCYYEMPAMDIGDCNNLLLDRVVIYSSPGMGWTMHGDLHHWELHDCRLEILPGSHRPMATAADGLHVSRSHGYFVMDGCEIGNCGDDCVNIHDNCAEGVERVDEHTLLVKAVNGRLSLKPGDDIELYNGDYSPLPFRARVVSSKVAGANVVLTFAETIPSAVGDDTIVWNHAFETGHVLIKNCRFHDNTVRGILMAARDVTVENNVFEHTAWRAFQFHTELVPGYWWEGHGAENVIFKGNKIIDCNLDGRDGGSNVFARPDLPNGPTSVPLFQNVLIADNEVVDPAGPSIDLQACKDVIITGNRIVCAKQMYAPNPSPGVIKLGRLSNVYIAGNSWSGQYATGAGVQYDPDTTSGIAIGDNTVAP